MSEVIKVGKKYQVVEMVLTSSGISEKLVEECEEASDAEMVSVHFDAHISTCIGCSECREFRPDF